MLDVKHVTESPPLSPDRWHPRVRGLHAWWVAARERRGRLPARRDFDPVQQPDLLPAVWMLDVVRPSMRFRYRLVGTAMTRALARDPTGEWLDVSPSRGPQWHEAAARYRDVVLRREPVWRKGPPRFTHDARFTTVETIVLPLSGDGEDVDMLINASIFYTKQGDAL